MIVCLFRNATCILLDIDVPMLLSKLLRVPCSGSNYSLLQISLFYCRSILCEQCSSLCLIAMPTSLTRVATSVTGFGSLQTLWSPTLISWLLMILTWLTLRVFVWVPTTLTVRSTAMLRLLTPIGCLWLNATIILLVLCGIVGLRAQEHRRLAGLP